jgi:hypothetical protein
VAASPAAGGELTEAPPRPRVAGLERKRTEKENMWSGAPPELTSRATGGR